MGRLSPEPPADFTLAGTWKLNRHVGDDPREVIRDKLARSRRAPAAGQAAPATSAGHAPPITAVRRSPFAHISALNAGRGDLLTLEQSPGELVVRYGVSSRRFTPGARSVVSVPDGVADQRTGWKGDQYVIEVKPQLGVPFVERYSLSPDGSQLVVEVHAGGGGMPEIDVTRYYDRVSETRRIVPRSD